MLNNEFIFYQKSKLHVNRVCVIKIEIFLCCVDCATWWSNGLLTFRR